MRSLISTAFLLVSLACPVVADGPALETRLRGTRLVLDWAAPSREPARFRILAPGGRFLAQRDGRRSAQGWIATVRVQGWPPGLYIVEGVSAAGASRARIVLP